MKLTKAFLTVGLSAFVVSATFAGDVLQQYVPKKSNLIMGINIKKLLSLPLIQKLKQENPKEAKEWNDNEKEFQQKYNLKYNDLVQRVLIFTLDKNKGGALIETKVSEEQFNKMLGEKAFDKQASYKIETIGDKKTYIFKRKSKIPGGQLLGKMTGHKKEEIALQFLKPGVAFIAKKADLPELIAGFAKKENATLLAKKESIKNSDDAILWTVFNVPAKPKTTKDQPQRGPMGGMGDGITGGVISLDFTGAKNEDFTALVSLACKDTQTVNKMTMQLQMGLMGLTGMLFKDSPDVGLEISKAIKIKPNGKDLSISISLPKALQDKIEKSVKAAKAKAAQGGQPAPQARK